jgi:hypothetical protein
MHTGGPFSYRSALFSSAAPPKNRPAPVASKAKARRVDPGRTFFGVD